jgi:hypothetical protein
MYVLVYVCIFIILIRQMHCSVQHPRFFRCSRLYSLIQVCQNTVFLTFCRSSSVPVNRKEIRWGFVLLLLLKYQTDMVFPLVAYKID